MQKTKTTHIRWDSNSKIDQHNRSHIMDSCDRRWARKEETYFTDHFIVLVILIFKHIQFETSIKVSLLIHLSFKRNKLYTLFNLKQTKWLIIRRQSGLKSFTSCITVSKDPDNRQAPSLQLQFYDHYVMKEDIIKSML